MHSFSKTGFAAAFVVAAFTFSMNATVAVAQNAAQPLRCDVRIVTVDRVGNLSRRSSSRARLRDGLALIASPAFSAITCA